MAEKGKMTEKNQTLMKMEALLKEETEKRKKLIMRREVPEKRTLENGLLTMTKTELDDIRYNVGLSGTSGLTKAELVQKLVPAIVKFAGEWFVSMFDEQYQAMRHLVEREGLSTQFRPDEARLDYFQSIGLVLSGAYHDKPAWYMPVEIIEEFNKLESSTFAKIVEWNTDVFRVASGLLFYYGVLDHDQLFSKIKPYVGAEDDFRFVDFMRVMMNGVCWHTNVAMSEKFAYYYTVVNPAATWEAQQSVAVGYARLPYTKVYDAGEENYIEATDSYKAMAQFFMRAFGADVLQAANIAGEITILFQNGGKMKEVLDYIGTLGTLEEAQEEELAPLLMAFHNSLRLWTFKGHTPEEMVSGHLDPEEDASVSGRRQKNKVGRNDPCPCGSGKKYKNCCLREKKEAAEDKA